MKDKLKKILNFSSSGKNYSKYIFSNILLQGSRFIVYYVFAKFAGSFNFGIWSQILLFTNLIYIFQFGALNGFRREIPFKLGQGNSNFTVSKISLIGVNFTLLTIFLISLISGFYYLIPDLSPEVSSFNRPLLYLSFALFAFSYYLQLTIQSIGYSFGLFNSINKYSNLTSLLFIVIAVILFYYPDIYFFLLAQAIAIIFSSVVWFRLNQFKIKPFFRFNNDTLKKILKTGFPIMLVGYLAILQLNLDRIFINWKLQLTDLGVFSIGATIILGFSVLYNNVFVVLQQRLMVKLGQGEKFKGIFKLTLKLSSLVIISFLTAYFPFVWLINKLIPAYLPEYIPALEFFYLQMISYFCYLLSIPAATLLYTFDEQWLNLIAQIAGVIIMALIFISYSFSGSINLTGVAVTNIIANFVFSLTIWILLIFKFKNKFFEK
ncbi:MAG TPA: lipopolysaccharide biosynthesis protein [Ignavibacteria bacterium]|nr:lipopolysaccharide biosynthesis protein [Ignavibacteria bacterium]